MRVDILRKWIYMWRKAWQETQRVSRGWSLKLKISYNSHNSVQTGDVETVRFVFGLLVFFWQPRDWHGRVLETGTVRRPLVACKAAYLSGCSWLFRKARKVWFILSFTAVRDAGLWRRREMDSDAVLNRSPHVPPSHPHPLPSACYLYKCPPVAFVFYSLWNNRQSSQPMAHDPLVTKISYD